MPDIPGFGETPLEIPFSRLRAATARRLTQSVTTKPQVTLHAEARATRLAEIQGQLRARGFAVRLTHLLARATARALALDRTLNGWVRDGTMVLSPAVNLGLAVQTDAGLVTPVLPDADRLQLAEFVARLDDLIARARAGTLHPRDLGNGTFTLSNLGRNRVRHFTPIVNPPQLGILGVGRLRTVPGWDGAGWRPVPELPLSLTFDHAAVDGQPAAAFLDRLISIVEDPPDALWL